MTLAQTMALIKTNLVDPAYLLLAGIALLVFAWGIVEFMMDIAKGEKGGNGKQHMLWGVVGMFILISASAIFNLLANTVAGFAK